MTQCWKTEFYLLYVFLCKKILTVNHFLPWRVFWKWQDLLGLNARSKKSLKRGMQNVISKILSLAVGALADTLPITLFRLVQIS